LRRLVTREGGLKCTTKKSECATNAYAARSKQTNKRKNEWERERKDPKRRRR
jgi:hypothetical protein